MGTPLHQILEVYEGADFAHTHIHRPGAAEDISGHKALLRVAADVNASTEVLIDSSVSSDVGSITITGGTGTILIEMTAADTLTLDDTIPAIFFSTPQEGMRELKFSLDLVDASGVAERILEGPLYFHRRVGG